MTWQAEDRAIQAQRAIERARALTVPCEYCHAPMGQVCTIPRNGEPLVHQAAHGRRLLDSGAI